MTNEQKAKIAQKLTEWEADTLLAAYGAYFSRLSNCNDIELEQYGLIKAEILRRMA